MIKNIQHFNEGNIPKVRFVNLESLTFLNSLFSDTELIHLDNQGINVNNLIPDNNIRITAIPRSTSRSLITSDSLTNKTN